uniref:Uncharacterized protein n=1 Tax=Ciona intestinalis TaxID=7719 RepID=F6T0D0_CIOIN
MKKCRLLLFTLCFFVVAINGRVLPKPLKDEEQKETSFNNFQTTVVQLHDQKTNLSYLSPFVTDINGLPNYDNTNINQSSGDGAESGSAAKDCGQTRDDEDCKESSSSGLGAGSSGNGCEGPAVGEKCVQRGPGDNK